MKAKLGGGPGRVWLITIRQKERPQEDPLILFTRLFEPRLGGLFYDHSRWTDQLAQVNTLRCVGGKPAEITLFAMEKYRSLDAAS